MSDNEAPNPSPSTLPARCVTPARELAQPSECQACEGHGHVWRDDEVPESGTRPCKICQGTGHNLRGYLPSGANAAL